MPQGAVYVIDSSAFMQAKNQYYAFDVAPKFWASIVSHAKKGQIESIDWIKREIDLGNDELKKWANKEFVKFFVSTNETSVTNSYAQVMQYINNHPNYLPAAKSQFASDPDGWLIAYAKANQRVIVTQEISEPNRQNKVKIPDVCDHFGIHCVDTFKLMRELGIRWV